MNPLNRLSAADRSELIEVIQKRTAGLSYEEKLWMAEAWGFMAFELRRVIGPVGRGPERIDLCDRSEVGGERPNLGG